MSEEATAHDWEDFWYAPEKFGTWHPEDTKDGDAVSYTHLTLPTNSRV